MDLVTFFKGCLPQILLGPLLNTLSHLMITDQMEPNRHLPAQS